MLQKFYYKELKNKVKITWLIWKLAQVFTGKRLSLIRHFKNLAVLFSEIWRHKFCPFKEECFIAFRYSLPETGFTDVKIIFMINNGFLDPKLYPLHIIPIFNKKKNFHVLLQK